MKKIAQEYSVCELPSNNKKMEEFITENKNEIMESVVSNIEYAINNRIATIEVFSFKGTDLMVVVDRESFRENLKLAFDYGMKTEYYELCAHVKTVLDKLNKLSFVIDYKPNNPTEYVKKETSAKRSSKKKRK